MRTIIGLSIVSLFALAATALGQNPGGYGNPFGGYGGQGGYNPGLYGGAGGAPGVYGGGLSPFLNLRSRGNLNSAVNYYNFVRPYTGGTFGNAYVPTGAMMPAPGGRFFPNLAPIYADEEVARQKVEADDKGVLRVDMPPAGHPAGFNNTMGYFGTGPGGARPAASLGTPRRR